MCTYYVCTYYVWAVRKYAHQVTNDECTRYVMLVIAARYYCRDVRWGITHAYIYTWYIDTPQHNYIVMEYSSRVATQCVLDLLVP